MYTKSLFQKFFISVMLLQAISCASKVTTSYGPNEISMIINHSITDHWTSEMIIQKLGEPTKINLDKKDGSLETWFYDHKKTGWQEWAFEINKEKKVTSLVYLPASDNFKEFTLDNIKKEWASFNCQIEKKEVLQIGLIKTKTILSCDHGNKTAELNKYQEVLKITVFN